MTIKHAEKLSEELDKLDVEDRLSFYIESRGESLADAWKDFGEDDFESEMKYIKSFGKSGKKISDEQSDKILQQLKDSGFEIIDTEMGHEEKMDIFNIQVISEEYFNEKVNEALED